jgi:hypothetical protein
MSLVIALVASFWLAPVSPSITACIWSAIVAALAAHLVAIPAFWAVWSTRRTSLSAVGGFLGACLSLFFVDAIGSCCVFAALGAILDATSSTPSVDRIQDRIILAVVTVAATVGPPIGASFLASTARDAGE